MRASQLGAPGSVRSVQATPLGMMVDFPSPGSVPAAVCANT